MRSIAIGTAIAILGCLAAPAQSLESAARIKRCVGANLPERTSRQAVRLRRVDRAGNASVSQAVILWRRFDAGPRALVRFSAPSDLEGSALLLVGNGASADLFLSLPALGTVRKVSGQSVVDSLFGSDFSFEDFERLQGLIVDTETRRLADSEIEGRAVYVVETRPGRGASSQYQRIVSYVDRETCVALRTELYDRDDRLRKEMKIPPRRVERRGRSHLPTLVLMKDRIDETYTEIIVDELRLDLELPATLFSQAELRRANVSSPPPP